MADFATSPHPRPRVPFQQPAHNACCPLSFPRDYHQQSSDHSDCAKHSSFWVITPCRLAKISTIRSKVVIPHSGSKNYFGHEHEVNGGGGRGQRSRHSDLLRAGRSGDRIPLAARFSASGQTGPGAHPASYKMGTGSFPGVKRPGRGVDNPAPSSAEVVERV